MFGSTMNSTCIYHGYFDVPQKQVKHLHKKELISNEVELDNIAKGILCPDNVLSKIKSTIDLKTRNILLIYNTSTDPLDSYGVKKIEISGLMGAKITVSVALLSPPWIIRGMPQFRGECLILSYPKGSMMSYDAGFKMVDCKIYEEEEFKQFKAMNDKIAIDESNENVTFDEYNGKLTLESYTRARDCDVESPDDLNDRDWYMELGEDEKSALQQCIKDKLECFNKLKNRIMGASLN